MKFKKILFITSILSMFASPALAERWTITEGPNNDWTGTWDINYGKLFSCSKQNIHNKTVLSGNCIVIRQGNRIAVSLRNMNNPCNYFGTVSDDGIDGQYFCTSGGPYYWSAVISK